jgi:hypothetical protein
LSAVIGGLPAFAMCLYRLVMTLEGELRKLNRNMIVFDLVLGAGALLAPSATLRVLGHDPPSPDGEQLFRRCGPIWLTFSAAHLLAHRRGRQRDWWALSWLRGTELLTDIIWSFSPAFSRPGARAGMWFAGVSNLAMTVGFASIARNGGTAR